MALIRSRRGLSAKIASGLGITRGAVAQWREVPADLIVRIESISGVAREELRPDLFKRTPTTQEARS
ncbi:hypothetical protein AD952_14520 [Acetobacter cerevisiae]|uniref:CI repressor n=2 Tax=Acetobacter cerevisiae TaxID=178900 RepID=A0A149UM49_9PROT|nr:YdaS family helix-turn-helix protein [Acetobacter cerevisiae]KXV69069.1 hypothetical protein AD952_14520 [Acetobacter cerevisiae]